jgi:putative addiction module component (TIGR02574 family)
MADPKRVMAEALTLSQDERVEVAARLLESVDAPDLQADLDDEALQAELCRRADEVASGEVEGRSWSEVRAAIERQLGL